MKKFFILTTLLIPAFLFISNAPSPKEKFDLSLKLKKGEKYTSTWTRSEDVISTSEAFDGEMQMHNEMEIIMDNEVTNVDPEGNISVMSTYKKFTLKYQDLETGEMKSYSTDHEPNNDPETIWYQVVGKKVFSKIDKKGNVFEVFGEKIDSDTILFPDSNYTRFDEIKEDMEMHSFYPADEIGLGDSWKFTSAMSRMYPMVVKNTCTYSEKEGEEMMIKLSGKISPNKNQVISREIGMPMTMNLSGIRTGWYSVNKSDGFVNRSESVYEVKGKIYEKDEELNKTIVSDIQISQLDTYIFIKN